MNIYEDEKSYVVQVSLPGVNKEDIKLDVEDGTFSLSAEIKKDERFSRHRAVSHECFMGTFNRSFTLPKYVNTDSAQARLVGGVLEVEMEKIEAKPRRSLQIS